MSLFASVTSENQVFTSENQVFKEALQKYFDGELDPRTIELL